VRLLHVKFIRLSRTYSWRLRTSALIAIRAQYQGPHLSVLCNLCALHVFVGYCSPLTWPGPVPVGSTAQSIRLLTTARPLNVVRHSHLVRASLLGGTGPLSFLWDI